MFLNMEHKNNRAGTNFETRFKTYPEVQYILFIYYFFIYSLYCQIKSMASKSESETRWSNFVQHTLTRTCWITEPRWRKLDQ